MCIATVVVATVGAAMVGAATVGFIASSEGLFIAFVAGRAKSGCRRVTPDRSVASLDGGGWMVGEIWS